MRVCLWASVYVHLPLFNQTRQDSCKDRLSELWTRGQIPHSGHSKKGRGRWQPWRLAWGRGTCRHLRSLESQTQRENPVSRQFSQNSLPFSCIQDYSKWHGAKTPHLSTGGPLIHLARSLTQRWVQEKAFLPHRAVQVQMFQAGSLGIKLTRIPQHDNHGARFSGRAECVHEVTELCYHLTSLSLCRGDTHLLTGRISASGCRLTGGPCLKDSWHVPLPAFFTLDWKHMLRTIRTVLACGSEAASYTSGWGRLNHFPREGGFQLCDIWRVAGSVWIHPRMIFISTCFSNFIRASVLHSEWHVHICHGQEWQTEKNHLWPLKVGHVWWDKSLSTNTVRAQRWLEIR